MSQGTYCPQQTDQSIASSAAINHFRQLLPSTGHQLAIVYVSPNRDLQMILIVQATKLQFIQKDTTKKTTLYWPAENQYTSTLDQKLEEIKELIRTHEVKMFLSLKVEIKS